VLEPHDASHIAVERRRARAAVKRDIATGSRDPLAVARLAWDDSNSIEASIRITEFLGSIAGIGAVKIPRILERLDISPRKRLGALGRHQIESLGEWLRARHTELGADIPTGKLIVVAGPTAVGKGTVLARIRQRHPEVRFSVSATTRDPRPGEIDGQHYFFVSNAEFDDLVANNQMLEWAVVHGHNRYGTPRAPIDDALRAGESIILEIDIQGARQVKAVMPEAVLVFLLPPSWDELVRRLETRGTEGPEEQARRLETAKTEFAAQDEFDVTIVNDDVDVAAEAVVQLMHID
jgi:guanylate kinase